MTNATTATKTKTVRQSRYCNNPECKKQFKVAPTSRKLYCKPGCSAKVQNKKRPRVNRLDKARRTPFFFYLARECKRAQTLQVLTGHTAESLVALYKVWAYSFKANSHGERRDFELSHIASVESSTTLGLLCAENLCVSPKSLNKAHGTKYYGHGKKISRTSILPKHHIYGDEPEGAVLDRVIAFLGEQLVDDVVRMAQLKPSQRSKHLDWLHENLDPANPEHRKHIAALPDMTTVALSNLKNQMQEKLASTFAIKRYNFKSFDVLYHELERHAQYRPELQGVFEELQQLNERKTYKNVWATEPHEEQALFNLLHGKSVADVQDALDSLVDRNTPVIDYNTINAYGGDFAPEVLERIPTYAPIKFTVQKDVVQTAPLKVLGALSVMIDSEASNNDYLRPMVAPVWEASPDFPPF
ncbi:hypothetical protein [Pseudomonas sp. GW101-3H06]|uniref:hypothetical protein n=1 Tax=Pseudomonas sp. GW101-3H06 TaxID=2751347 RepID=UPI001A92AC06|nr:hypothetical protein [Pseudomonas sp. GW101-3H06]